MAHHSGNQKKGEPDRDTGFYTRSRAVQPRQPVCGDVYGAFLATLKKENPEINCTFYRQDNAGCYHAAITITRRSTLRNGDFIRRQIFYDFALTQRCITESTDATETWLCYYGQFIA